MLLLLSVFLLMVAGNAAAEEYVCIQGSEFDDGIINETLANNGFSNYTVENGLVKFGDDEEYFRFLISELFPSNQLAVDGNFTVCIVKNNGGKLNLNFSSNLLKYLYVFTTNGKWSSGFLEFGNVHVGCGSGQTSAVYSDTNVILTESDIKLERHGVSLGRIGIITEGINVIDNNGYDVNIFKFNRIKYPVEIITAPHVMIYNENTLLGETDDSGKVIVYLPTGVYDLKLIMSNSIETVSVKVERGGNTKVINFGKVDIKVINGLTGNMISGVKVSGDVNTEINGEGTLYMFYGDYILKFNKDGYWDKTLSLHVDGDKNITIEMYPSGCIFRIEQEPKEIVAYPNSYSQVVLKIKPLKDVYATKLYFSNSNVVRIEKNGVNIPRSDDGSYILGDLMKDEEMDIKVVFATQNDVGNHLFSVKIEGIDILGKECSAEKVIEYYVEDLPFIIQLPTWKIGDNLITITEQSGESYGILLTLRDVNGTEIWSDSASFNAYDSKTFKIPINNPGKYILEINAKAGAVKTYIPINVVEPIRLLTKTVEAGKGQVAEIDLEVLNPSEYIKYYYAVVNSSIFGNETPEPTKFSVAPNDKKIVSVKFKVPENENLTYDAYELSVEVYEQGGEKVFSDKVILKITENSFFIPIGGDISGIPVWALVVAGILLLGGLGIFILRK